ncbi:steroidogenic acute regulatory protein-like [Mustelus asterias]
MLPATFKLFCGISHQHFRNMTGLKRTAVAALAQELRRMKIKENFLSENWDTLAHKKFLEAFKVEEARLEPKTLDADELFYVKQGEEALQKALGILNQEAEWTTEIKMENGDIVVSKVLPETGKVFKLEAVLDASTEHVYNELYEKVDQMNLWNPSVKHIDVLQKIGKETMVTYEIMGDTASNIIGRRDFVSVRHCWKEGSCCYLTGMATESKSMPPQKGFVRAETSISCIILDRVDNTNKTRFTWLLSMDLKGWLPKSLINQALSQAQVDFTEHLRQQLATISTFKLPGSSKNLSANDDGTSNNAQQSFEGLAGFKLLPYENTDPSAASKVFKNLVSRVHPLKNERYFASQSTAPNVGLDTFKLQSILAFIKASPKTLAFHQLTHHLRRLKTVQTA